MFVGLYIDCSVFLKMGYNGNALAAVALGCLRSEVSEANETFCDSRPLPKATDL